MVGCVNQQYRQFTAISFDLHCR